MNQPRTKKLIQMYDKVVDKCLSDDLADSDGMEYVELLKRIEKSIGMSFWLYTRHINKKEDCFDIFMFPQGQRFLRQLLK